MDTKATSKGREMELVRLVIKNIPDCKKTLFYKSAGRWGYIGFIKRTFLNLGDHSASEMLEIRDESGGNYTIFPDGEWVDIEIKINHRGYIDAAKKIGNEYEAMTGKGCTVYIEY